jgi:hypothetical protein
MSDHDTTDLIHEWNVPSEKPAYPLLLNDETLRDGLQSPSVTDPPIADKLEIIHCIEELGITSAAIGLPGAGPHAYNDVLAIAGEISRHQMNIYPYCAARTHKNDIIPIIEIQGRPASRSRRRCSFSPVPFDSSPRTGPSTRCCR